MGGKIIWKEKFHALIVYPFPCIDSSWDNILFELHNFYNTSAWI